ncbi:M14 family zinc carboxypeptidase [Alkalicoccus halolimnae]|uniref:M14 family zinc carboxypeptidase n=1 Tax=Alkalicoccus halolimnae TaxID=1667239 RepID=A0A5C7F1E8_9BACI|nr:M14 family zinc carboxypeptidase [Alkalicoccus halolimnae]TXF81848.1 carboxypeptidase [Alkalicoccus halolimnae]
MKKTFVAMLIFLLTLSIFSLPAGAVGNGPNYNGNETIKGERLTSNEDLLADVQRAAERSDSIELEIIGQSVKGRDIPLVKFGNNPDNPTILFLTQQHGNEVLITEGALNVIKNLSNNNKHNRGLAEEVNVFFVPRLNPDGAVGDVDFDISDHVAGGIATRTNANNIDLNRDHNTLEQPETYALHNNVLRAYDIDYLVDFHHQGARSGIDGEYVSGSILYPTNEGVDPEVVEMSKQLGSVMYDAVEDRGFGLLGKYNGGSANTIARNGLAYEYDIATLLFEMRGMIDHSNPNQVLGQKSNGYLIQQAVISMEAAIDAIADTSINEADVTFWDELEVQSFIGEEEATE